MTHIKLNALALACGLALIFPATANATEGLDPIAFDAYSAGIGGADTALSLSALSLVRNPAAIAGFDTRVDASISLVMPSLTLDDQAGTMTLNEGVDGEPLTFPLFGVAFGTRIGDQLHVGLGVYARGGSGADFKHLATFADDDPSTPLAANPSPATYDTHSNVMMLHFAPTVAWEISDSVSIGAALQIGLSKMEFSHSGMQFPEVDGDHVYYPHSLDFTSDWAVNLSGSFGLQISLLDDDLRFGTSITLGGKPTFEGTLNLDEQLEYTAKTDDFGLPIEAGLGVAGRLFDDRLLLSLDFRFALWSGAVDTVTFAADANGQAPPELAHLELPFALDWRDRMVFALGAEYAVIADTFFARLGYSYSPSPVTRGGLNPLFPAITEHHLTLGLGLRNFAGGLTIDLAFEVALANDVTSDASNQMAFEPTMPGMTPSPNGYQVTVAMSQITPHLAVGWVF